MNGCAVHRNGWRMTNEHERPVPHDDLDDSWFDLPVLEPAPRKAREPEAELDESWFDRPGKGLRRSDVIGPR